MLPDENKHTSWHKSALRPLAAAGSLGVYCGIFCCLLVFSAGQALLAGSSSSATTVVTANLLTSQPQLSRTSHLGLHYDLWYPSIQSEWFFEIEENKESKPKKSKHQHLANTVFRLVISRAVFVLPSGILQQSAYLYASSGRQRLQRYHAWKSHL